MRPAGAVGTAPLPGRRTPPAHLVQPRHQPLAVGHRTDRDAVQIVEQPLLRAPPHADPRAYRRKAAERVAVVHALHQAEPALEALVHLAQRDTTGGTLQAKPA